MQIETTAAVIFTVVILAFLKGLYHMLKDSKDINAKRQELDKEIKELKQQLGELEKKKKEIE